MNKFDWIVNFVICVNVYTLYNIKAYKCRYTYIPIITYNMLMSIVHSIYVCNLCYSYLDSVREFSEIKIVPVVELDGIRVGPGQLSPLQSFLDGSGAIQRTRQVSSEHQEHHYLHVPLVQRPSQTISTPNHYRVVRVVPGISRVLGVHSTRTEHSVQPRFFGCNKNHKAV